MSWLRILRPVVEKAGVGGAEDKRGMTTMGDLGDQEALAVPEGVGAVLG